MSINFVLKSRLALEPFLSYRCLSKVVTKKDEYEKRHFYYRTLLRLAVFCVAFGQLYECYWSQRHWKRKPGSLNELLAYLWEIIRLLLKYCIYCASAPSLHRESTDSLMNILLCLIYIILIVTYQLERIRAVCRQRYHHCLTISHHRLSPNGYQSKSQLDPQQRFGHHEVWQHHFDKERLKYQKN